MRAQECETGDTRRDYYSHDVTAGHWWVGSLRLVFFTRSN
jgi:hypothetical protein